MRKFSNVVVPAIFAFALFGATLLGLGANEAKAQVTVTPSANFSINAGATDTYTVVLDTAPTGNLTVVPSVSPDDGVISISTTPLVFTASTWNASQDVVVTASSSAEGVTATITHTVSGAGDVTVSPLTVTGFGALESIVSPNSLTMGAGSSSIFTVRLGSEPQNGRVIEVAWIVAPPAALNYLSTTPQVGDRLRFTAANWNTPQAVTVSATPAADTVGSDQIRFHAPVVMRAGSHIGTIPAPSPVDITVTAVTGLVFNPDPLSVTEGMSEIYLVDLSSEPTGNVTVTPNSVGDLDVSPASLIFTPSDWVLGRTVTVTARSDDDADDESETVTHMVSGFGNVTAADLRVNIIDANLDDTPRVILSPANFRINAGASDTYTVVLNTAPVGNVTVVPSSPDDSVISLSSTPLTFSTTTWNTAQTVTVTAIADSTTGTATITRAATIIHTVSGYGAVTMADEMTVTVTVLPLASVSTPTALTLMEGGSATYTIALNTQPRQDITVTASVGPSGAPFTISVGVLTFSTMNWNMAQVVTVTAAGEGAGTSCATIVHEVSGDTIGGVTVNCDKTDDRVTDLNHLVSTEVARAMVNSQVRAIAQRIRQAGDTSASMAGNLTVGGQSTLTGVLTTHGKAFVDGTLDMKTLLGGSDFVLPLHASGAGQATGLAGVTLWGGGDYRVLSGSSNTLDWEGDMFSASLGADARLRDDLLAGVAVSWSESDLDYDFTNYDRNGAYEVSLTSVHPYISWTALDGLDIWATVGYGWGELEDTDDTMGGQRSSSDVTMQTVGGGGSAQVLESNGATLRIKGEALHTTMDVEGSTRIAATEVEARQMRFGLEASHTHLLANGGRLIPALEVGMRHDAGDGRTGTGAEVGGSVRYTDAAHGLTIESHGRVLLGHSGDYEDWGVGGSVRLAAGQDGHGLSFRLQPTWGATASRVAQVWAQEAAATVSSASRPRDGRVDLNLGYGLGWDDNLVTPYGQLTLTNGQTRAYRLGSRMQLGDRFLLNLEGTRQETATQPVDHGILLQIGMDF